MVDLINWHLLPGPYSQQLYLLKQVCSRGRNMFLNRKDSIAVDMFEHLETEIGRLAVQIYDRETRND